MTYVNPAFSIADLALLSTVVAHVEESGFNWLLRNNDEGYFFNIISKENDERGSPVFRSPTYGKHLSNVISASYFDFVNRNKGR